MGGTGVFSAAITLYENTKRELQSSSSTSRRIVVCRCLIPLLDLIAESELGSDIYSHPSAQFLL